MLTNRLFALNRYRQKYRQNSAVAPSAALSSGRDFVIQRFSVAAHRPADRQEGGSPPLRRTLAPELPVRQRT